MHLVAEADADQNGPQVPSRRRMRVILDKQDRRP